MLCEYAGVQNFLAVPVKLDHIHSKVTIMSRDWEPVACIEGKGAGKTWLGVVVPWVPFVGPEGGMGQMGGSFLDIDFWLTKRKTFP